MTNKEQFIYNLHQARVNVIRWGGMIKLLSTDIPIRNYKLELTLFDTDFGKWFYEEASLMTAVNIVDVIDNIENIFKKMHKHFMAIYDISVLHRKKTFLGTEKALDVAEKNVIFTYYQEFVQLSDEFQKVFRRFERIIQAKPEEEFTMFAYSIENQSIRQNIVQVEVEKQDNNIYAGGARGAF